MTAPTVLLHGPSTSGSAAELVSEAPTPAAAPAKATPLVSSARRSSRPLPATGSSGGAWPLLDLRMVMASSLASRSAARRALLVFFDSGGPRQNRPFGSACAQA